jgi:adenylosuccinate lyase
MPQKRNPEIAEHLGTLARVVRYHAAHMSENLVHDHERDGRAWKGEWALLPGACLATGKALALLHDLLEHLEVNADRMRDNLLATKGFVQAEHVMLALSPKLGKQSAHALVYRVAMDAANPIPQVLQVPSPLLVLFRLLAVKFDHPRGDGGY